MRVSRIYSVYNLYVKNDEKCKWCNNPLYKNFYNCPKCGSYIKSKKVKNEKKVAAKNR